MWWINPDDYEEPPELPLNWEQRTCFHDWKKTVLIISTVYDCTKCGVKKEEYDKWEEEKF
jgi:hypothetical protein